MGYGLPAALGACIAEGEKRVICLDGDGSLMMNLQELQTIGYNNCNMKLFVLNNNGYHSIRQTQNNLFKNGLIGVCDGNGVNFPPFDKLADTFGFKYFKIDSLDGIEEKLQEVLNTDGPVLCEQFWMRHRILHRSYPLRCCRMVRLYHRQLMICSHS